VIAVDVGAMINTMLADRARCRLAGIAAPDVNSELTTHLLALAARLRDRHGAAAAMRAAFQFWDELEVGAGEVVQ
jgi:hypothetical protein